jgi:hypothetical protein
MRTLENNEHHCRNLEDCNGLLTRLGFRPSAGGWEDSRQVAAFSVETFGPGTYNHPRAEVYLHKASGRLEIFGDAARGDRLPQPVE